MLRTPGKVGDHLGAGDVATWTVTFSVLLRVVLQTKSITHDFRQISFPVSTTHLKQM